VPKYVKRQFQLGEYWLDRRAGSLTWCRCRFNPATRQTERVGLATMDYDEAKERLTAWFAAHGKGPMEKEAMLGEVLLGYYEAHGKNVVSVRDVQISSRYWLEHFGDVPAKTVSGHEPMAEFKRFLKTKGFADNYVNRVLSVGRAALTRAYERGLLIQLPIVKGIRGASGEAKGRPLEMWELRHMLKGPDYLARFVLLSLATGARPAAILELDWQQVDFTGGVLRLNPVGRAQTKKRRADVPMCSELRKLLIAWGPSEGPVVAYKGNRVSRVKMAWQRTREGLAEGANPYSLRHTVARWLRAKSVPVWEVAALLGHKMPGHSMTEMYAAADPNHMQAAKTALDELLRAICVSDEHGVFKAKSLKILERANGFEPSTLTLAT
jgi:integrase